MTKASVILETANELVEQIVMSFDPDAEVFVEYKDGSLDIKRRYVEIQERIYTILDNNLNGDRA